MFQFYFENKIGIFYGCSTVKRELYPALAVLLERTNFRLPVLHLQPPPPLPPNFTLIQLFVFLLEDFTPTRFQSGYTPSSSLELKRFTSYGISESDRPKRMQVVPPSALTG
jgi:hypothetical protein